jgi:hypothetical protein
MRGAAVIQSALLTLMAVFVLSRASLVLPDLARAAPWLIWVVVAVSSVALLLNLVTPSTVERRTWAPVALVLLISSVTVALSAS